MDTTNLPPWLQLAIKEEARNHKQIKQLKASRDKVGWGQPMSLRQQMALAKTPRKPK